MSADSIGVVTSLYFATKDLGKTKPFSNLEEAMFHLERTRCTAQAGSGEKIKKFHFCFRNL